MRGSLIKHLPESFLRKKCTFDKKIAGLAKCAGVKIFVLCGSYTAEFAEKNMELRDANYHKEPYVETRLLQDLLTMYG